MLNISSNVHKLYFSKFPLEISTHHTVVAIILNEFVNASEVVIKSNQVYLVAHTVEPLLYDHPQNHIGVVV